MKRIIIWDRVMSLKNFWLLISIFVPFPHYFNFGFLINPNESRYLACVAAPRIRYLSKKKKLGKIVRNMYLEFLEI